MRARDYFPLGVATGSAFCNRKQETELLIENIKNAKHTLLMATRRYGKSSLALHALKLSKHPYIEIDFYMATSEKMVEKYILGGITELVGTTLGPVNKLLTSIKRYVKNLKPKIDIGNSNFKLELTSEEKSDSATNVKEGLLLLEKLFQEKNKHAVILMDEFQNVGILSQGMGIEAAIRHVAQKTKNLTFIFSGSNRKMLQTMFEDKVRPLYKLCWKIDVKRISRDHYISHFQKAAKASWKKILDESVIDRVLILTERHPFYINKLADRLWTFHDHKNMPNIQSVDDAWSAILEEERSDAIREISLLSLGQKNVLYQIAIGNMHITDKQSILILEMSSSSIMTALTGLIEKDVIEKVDGVYQIINPVVKFYALKN